jgi:hypothetical protein
LRKYREITLRSRFPVLTMLMIDLICRLFISFIEVYFLYNKLYRKVYLSKRDFASLIRYRDKRDILLFCWHSQQKTRKENRQILERIWQIFNRSEKVCFKDTFSDFFAYVVYTTFIGIFPSSFSRTWILRGRGQLPHTPEGETSQKKEKQGILRITGFDTDFNGDSPSARSRTDTLLRLKPSQ